MKTLKSLSLFVLIALVAILTTKYLTKFHKTSNKHTICTCNK